MVRRVRWAILGTGSVAQSFAQDLVTTPDAELVAVGSRSLDRARAFAGKLGVRHPYGSYEETVQDPEVDVVYIATPNSRHVTDCLLALDADKALLCEKPFAQTADEARTIIEVANRKNVFCMEAMWTRFLPAVADVCSKIQAGEIGELMSITPDFGYPSEAAATNRLFDASLGGGAMLDRGVYGVSLASWFFGSPDVVKATAHIKAGVDKHSEALLSWADGRSAVITCSLVTRTSNTALLVGSKGSILLEEPFCCPPGFSVRHSAVTGGGSLNRLKRIPGAYKITPVLRLMRSSSRYVTGKRIGHGYRYEAMEVNRCILENRLESAIMPLAETLSILNTLDRIRREWTVSPD